MERVATKKTVNGKIYNIFKALAEGLVKNDTNPSNDKKIEKAVQQVRANETPNLIASKEKGVQDYSKTIPEEGRVVVKARIDARVNEKEAIRISNEKAEEKSKQKENSQKGRDIE